MGIRKEEAAPEEFDDKQNELIQIFLDRCCDLMAVYKGEYKFQHKGEGLILKFSVEKNIIEDPRYDETK